ncbi:hypothetical protein Ccrd_025477 [Cynara cardunculus var. scolymus]|uniref:Uncharacterized protein n=1 Tax=Cynara cardunculus var. scolymus TaxID=59895 RepID=A0A118JNS5_CYNCS|nr:hypothetical protein Ccrd_025477 [Cynara cardunculus var. scolymus]
MNSGAGSTFSLNSSSQDGHSSSPYDDFMIQHRCNMVIPVPIQMLRFHRLFHMPKKILERFVVVKKRHTSSPNVLGNTLVRASKATYSVRRHGCLFVVESSDSNLADAVYGTRVRVTARKSVPIPIRRTFSIPHRDEAGPSRTRDRSVTPPPPPPPPEDRAPVARPTGMTPTKSYMFSGMTHDVLTHRMKLESHDHLIEGFTNMMATHHETMNKTIELLVHTMVSVRRLYSYVFLLMMIMMVILGWMILWVRH